MSKIRVLSIYVGEPPKVEMIENKLEVMQNFVGGHFETVGVTEDIVLLCNDKGAICDPPLPESLILMRFNHPYDIVRGNLFFCSYNEKGDLVGLTDEQLNEIKNRLKYAMVTEEGKFILGLEMS